LVVVVGEGEGLTVEVGGERKDVDSHGGRFVGYYCGRVGLKSNPLMFVELGGGVVVVAVAGAIFGGADGRFYPADATTSGNGGVDPCSAGVMRGART
jgi:hypothetical protein